LPIVVHVVSSLIFKKIASSGIWNKPKNCWLEVFLKKTEWKNCQFLGIQKPQKTIRFHERTTKSWCFSGWLFDFLKRKRELQIYIKPHICVWEPQLSTLSIALIRAQGLVQFLSTNWHRFTLGTYGLCI